MLRLLLAVLSCFVASAHPTVLVEVSQESPLPIGTRLILTVLKEGTAKHWYRFKIKAPNQPTRLVKDFGPENELLWAPMGQEGFYIIEITVRDLFENTETDRVMIYEVSSNVQGKDAVVNPTVHPLVFVYSAPACKNGSKMTVYFEAPGSGLVQSAPGLNCDGELSMNTYLAGLRPNTDYEAYHVITTPDGTVTGARVPFTTGAPLDDLAGFTAMNDAPDPRAQGVLLSSMIGSRPVATDLAGNLLWYYYEPEYILTRHETGGTFLAIKQAEGLGTDFQTLRVFDLAGVPVRETNAEALNAQLRAQGRRTIGGFHHEARLLSGGQIMVLASVEKIVTDDYVPGPANVVGDMIIVLNQNLDIVWTWNSFDFLDVHRKGTQNDVCSPGACAPVYLGMPAYDWTHGNSLAETADGSILYSSRSQDWVIKIDYRGGAGNGRILWKLGKDGDFQLDSTEAAPWFSHQHDPQLDASGALMLFDNSNLRRAADSAANSRGQVLQIDETKRTARFVLNADLGDFAFALGSAQKLKNGNYFFDIGYRMNNTGRAVETTPDGKINYAVESTGPVYRTFRLQDMYTKQ
jgi:hypothetical protein